MKHLVDLNRHGHGICGARGDVVDELVEVDCKQCIGLFIKIEQDASQSDD